MFKISEIYVACVQPPLSSKKIGKEDRGGCTQAKIYVTFIIEKKKMHYYTFLALAVPFSGMVVFSLASSFRTVQSSLIYGVLREFI